MARRAVLIGVPAPGLDVEYAVEQLSPVLDRAGFCVEPLVGEQATRDAIVDRLEELVEGCEAGDAYALHYFGHGGRIRFTGFEGTHSYICCHERGGFEAVLDRELSDLLTQLDAGCHNVTAIFDCCYSGELVRADGHVVALDDEIEAPTWAKGVLEKPPTARLAIDSNPRILRLGGASPKQQAFALVRGGAAIGVLTEAFIDTVEAVGERWDRLTWAGAIHPLRERVFERLRFEGQWPALVGPRNRLLFSTREADMPGTVGLVPSTSPDEAWLRAGWLQGVAIGDRWTVANLTVDAHGQPEFLAEGRIEAVERCRSILALERGELPDLAGFPAFPSREADRSAPRSGPARVDDLERALARHRPDPCPIRWSWGKIGGPELPAHGARLRPGERIWASLDYPEDSPPQNWFVSVVLFDGHRRPRLLSARMPEGIELRPGDRELVGVRAGVAKPGYELRWPEGLEGPADMLLLFLASRRPIGLAHIVPEQPLDEFEALIFQGLVGRGTRSVGPEAASGCAWGRVDFALSKSS